MLATLENTSCLWKGFWEMNRRDNNYQRRGKYCSCWLGRIWPNPCRGWGEEGGRRQGAETLMAIIVLWGAMSHSVHGDQSQIIQPNSSQNKLLFCSFVAGMKLSLQVSFYIFGNSVLDGITLNCENPAGAFDASIFKTQGLSAQITQLSFILCVPSSLFQHLYL